MEHGSPATQPLTRPGRPPGLPAGDACRTRGGLGTVDALVVGAGVVGAATAFHLARSGRRVVVLERKEVASGATGASAGLIRTLHADPVLTRLAVASHDELERWPQVVGGSIGFVRTGCLHRVPSSRDGLYDPLANGIRSPWTFVTGAELRRRLPWIRWPKRALYAYEPQAGYACPRRSAELYLARVEAMGGVVLRGVTALALHLASSEMAEVMSTAGLIAAPVVVVATGARSTGAWTGGATPARMDRVVETRRVALQRLRLPPGFGGIPAYVDEDPGFFFRPDGHGEVLLGCADESGPADPDDLEPSPGAPWLRRARGRVERIIGRPTTFRELASGVDAFTPDGLPVIDRCHPAGGVYTATGFSGSGFEVAPAVGRLLASWIGRGVRHQLLQELSLDRFDTPDPGTPAEAG